MLLQIQDLLSGSKLGCGGKLCSALRTGLINLPRQGRRLTEVSCIDRYEAWMMQDPLVFIKQASHTSCCKLCDSATCDMIDILDTRG